MACILIPGQRSWGMTRDRNGNRVYKITHIVVCGPTDGPANVLSTPGLPLPGAPWLVDGDADPWAFCKLDATVSVHPGQKEGEPSTHWMVEHTFSTETDSKRCKDAQLDDPLLEAQKVSGSFTQYQQEERYDRFGAPILNSAFELFHGPPVEFDKNRSTVEIEQNVPLLQVGLVNNLMDCVNDGVMWGLPPRTVKLSRFTWEKLYYGSCFSYYKRRFGFDVRLEGYDRHLLDEGTKALAGHWDGATGNYIVDSVGGVTADATNPGHFNRFKDRNGENCNVILNGAGLPSDVTIGIGAQLVAVLSPGGTVVSVGIVAAGSGYANGTYALTFTGGDGTGAAGTVTISGGAVSSTAMTSNGTGYTSSPQVSFNVSGGPGSILASRYPSVNLLLLGIPVTF